MNRLKIFLHNIFTSNRSGTRWLSALRIGTALALLGKIISEFRFLNQLYGSDGFVSVEIARYSQHPFIPTILGMYHYAAGFCSEAFFLKAFVLCHLLFAVFLLIGFMTRFSAFICWGLMVIVFNSSHLTSYGFDGVLLSLLFYSMIFPVGKKIGDASLTPIYHKTVQLHVCLIYFVNGISKIHGAGWQRGGGMWDAINQPQFQSMLTPMLQKILMLPHVPALICWSAIIVEIAYPFLIWVRRINVIALWLIILLHVSIALVMGLWLFAFIMIVFNLVAFGHLLKRA